jgi:hypothetical protein
VIGFIAISPGTSIASPFCSLQGTNLDMKEPAMSRGRCLQAGLTACLTILGIALAGNVAALATTTGGPWDSAIQQVDTALARKEYSAALRAANDAYTLAQGTTRWDGMVTAGDLYRRIGEATGLRRSFESKAREAYQKAFFRARQQASVEGVLRATEGYAALGDAQMVGLGLRVAERLAARDPEAQADIKSFRARIGDGNVPVRDLR